MYSRTLRILGGFVSKGAFETYLKVAFYEGFHLPIEALIERFHSRCVCVCVSLVPRLLIELESLGMRLVCVCVHACVCVCVQMAVYFPIPN